MDEIITSVAPNKVFIEGISPQIKYPNIIAKINERYFKGVTKETSENLYDWLNHKFAIPPKTPINESNNKSLKLGITQPKGIVKIPANNIAPEKLSEISHTGSVTDNCLIAIAT